MTQLLEQELFTIEEAAKWCGLSPRAFYMHHRRGHIEPVRMLCHRLYFTREAIEEFRTNYIAYKA